MNWDGSSEAATPFVPFNIRLFFKLFISLSARLGSSIIFPGGLLFLKLYTLYIFWPCLLLLIVDLYISDHQ